MNAAWNGTIPRGWLILVKSSLNRNEREQLLSRASCLPCRFILRDDVRFFRVSHFFAPSRSKLLQVKPVYFTAGTSMYVSDIICIANSIWDKIKFLRLYIYFRVVKWLTERHNKYFRITMFPYLWAAFLTTARTWLIDVIFLTRGWLRTLEGKFLRSPLLSRSFYDCTITAQRSGASTGGTRLLSTVARRGA